MRTLRLVCLGAVCALVLAAPAPAADYDDAVDGNWDGPTTWSPAGVTPASLAPAMLEQPTQPPTTAE